MPGEMIPNTTFGYDSLQDDASELILDAGVATIMRRTIQNGGDPWNPNNSSVEDFNINMVIGNFEDRMIDGVHILYGDIRAYISAKPLLIQEPNGTQTQIVPNIATDKVLLYESEYSFINVIPVNPGGVDLLFEVQIRGAIR